MAILEDKISMLGSKPQGEQQSAVNSFAPVQTEMSLEDKISSLQPKKDSSIVEDYILEPVSRGIKQFNIGIANMLGLPKVGIDMLRAMRGEGEGDILPSGREIQQKMADMGMTYEPGTEPNEVSDRVYQNLGAASMPLVGIYAKGMQTTKTLSTEVLAAIGGGGGGKIAESTDWGQAHPTEARAIGELFGGIGLSSTTLIKKIATTPTLAAYKLASAPYRGVWAKKRAVKRMSELVQDPKTALKGIDDLKETTLTASQKAGERRFSGFRKKVEAESPLESQFGVEQRSETLTKLKKEAVGKEKVAVVRQFLDKRLKNLAKEAEASLSQIKTAKNPEFYSTQARNKLWEAYDEARRAENKIWSNLGEGNKVEPSNVMNAYKQEVADITRGGDMGEIDSFLRTKLGQINRKGELVGGKFLSNKNNKATAKELQQFSSRIGRQIRTLSEQAGNTNKIRILNKIKRSALKDIEDTVVGEDYKAAIAFSRDLNKRFTEGNIGSVLGFNRGLATPDTMVLDKIIGSGGEKARLGIEQLFEANPKAKKDVEDFIKSRFALSAENIKTQRIDSRKGVQFVKQNNRLLDGFPKIKAQIEEAIVKQKKVDSFTGASDITDVSPIVKEKTAASLFINSDPGDEMSRVLKYGKSQGKTKKFFSDLVKETKKDKTGSAFNGLKNALTEELINGAEMAGKTDELTGMAFISGNKFLTQLRRVKSPALKSGLLNKNEYMALEKIGEAFKRIEIELTSPVSKNIMTDAPGQVLDILARITGAQMGGMAGASSAGGSLQMAQIGSGLGKKLINAITKDEAKNLLIEATRNPKLLRELISDAGKLTVKQEQALFIRIKDYAIKLGNRSATKINKIQAPVMGIVPPIASAGREQETLEEKIKKLIK